MVRCAVVHFKSSIRLGCQAFGINQSGYHYQAKQADDNEVIADWLIRLTTAQRNWGFGLCFLCLRNIKGFKWNRKKVYRIYRALELNFRIKPKKRLVRERPDPLYIGKTMLEWALKRCITIIYTQPGNPQ